MKPLFRHILLMICLVLAWTVAFQVPAWGAEAEDAAPTAKFEADAEAQLLVDLINAARKDPLGTAATLGMDPAKIVADFPELADILTNGLPELVFDERLYRSAQKHTADMLANSYYAYESSDGRTLWHRMNDEGYAAIFSGESLGLLFFNNFISPETAVGRIFANMYRDELDPAGSGSRNILNPDAQDIGASIGGGIYKFNGYTGNVYLATCDFGATPETYELQVINLINQVRANPGPVLAELGIGINEADFPELADLFAKGGLAPLWFDPALYRAADTLVKDMFKNNHFNPRTADGRTANMRARENKYRSEWIAETRMRNITCDQAVSPSETLSRFFKQMVTRAFREDQNQREQHLFSATAVDAGIRIMAGAQPEMGFICGDNLHILVADFAARDEYPDTALTGVVYADRNSNGIYDIGEELAGVGITIKLSAPGGKATHLTTGPAGGYGMRLAPGRYRVSVDTEVAEWVRWIDVDAARSTWLSVALPFNEDEGIIAENRAGNEE
jgi:hypothetical protein